MREDRPAVVEALDRNMQAGQGASGDLVWHDPKSGPFQVAGFAWFEEDRVYRRMPVRPAEPLPAAVDQLANATAGGQIRFVTDSTQVAVRVRLAGVADMNHMPATGQCGFDAYIEQGGRKVFYNTTKYNRTLQNYEHLLCDLERGNLYNITLNFPLYMGVHEVLVGLESGARVSAPPAYDSPKRVVIYGTSITQGGCASRPGMCYSNILSRRINLEFINLGFSGNGKGEPAVARVMAGIGQVGLFVLDYEANAGGLEGMRRTLGEFVGILREAHQEASILVVSRFPYSTEGFHGKAWADRLASRDFQRSMVDNLRIGGDRNVHFLDGSEVLGPDWQESTVDSVHPNDLGFMRLADALTPVVRRMTMGNPACV